MKVCPQCQQQYAAEVDYCPADGTKLRTPRGETEDPLIGRALDGRWIIEEKLGEGGMGAVYKGHQKSVSRTVAIKTLRPQLVDSDEFVDRFFREAKIAATISHPNSVTILDYGESDDGTLFLAMEYLEGELLTDRIESGLLTVKQVVEIGLQVASALAAAHEKHIVHRDLKPDNIFLIDVPGGATFIKVLDFGIAKMLDSKTQVTKTGMIFGTPEYMSPEQCRGAQIDGRSDLYSLGCILYELVGGRTPFRGTTPMAVLMAHVNDAAPTLSPASTTASMLPPAVENVIMRLLEKNPDHRFESAAQLHETLDAVLASLDNPDAPVSAELVAPVPSREIVAPAVNIGFDATMGFDSGEIEARPAPSATDSMEPSTRRGIPVALFAVLAVLVAAIVGVAALLLPSDPPEPPTADTTPPVAAAAEPAVEPPEEVAAAEEPLADVEEVAVEEEPAVVAAVTEKPKTKAKTKTKRKKAKATATKNTEPEAEPEKPAVQVAATPEPEPKVAEPVASKPAVKPPPKKKKKKKKRNPFDKLNKGAEKLRDNIKKGTDRAAEDVFEGLMDQ